MTAFKGLSSFGDFRLPGVGATIEVSRIVMALIIRPCENAIRGGSEEADASEQPATRVYHFPDVVMVRFQLFQAETEFPVTCLSTRTRPWSTPTLKSSSRIVAAHKLLYKKIGCTG